MPLVTAPTPPRPEAPPAGRRPARATLLVSLLWAGLALSVNAEPAGDGHGHGHGHGHGQAAGCASGAAGDGACAGRGAGRKASPAGAGIPAPTDGRTAVPILAPMAERLKTHMRSHLAQVQAAVAALSAGDFVALEQAAGALAGGPGHGGGHGGGRGHQGGPGAAFRKVAPGFTARAGDFHQSAEQLREAARAGDGPAAQQALAGTLSHCVACHAAYRLETVDRATWRTLNAEAAARGP